MKNLTLGMVIEGIRNRDNKILTMIYHQLYPKVERYIRKNGGNSDDAKDVFQESIIVIFKQIENNSLNIKSGFEPYLFGISRLLWLKILRRREVHNRNIQFIEEPENDYGVSDIIVEEELELRLFRKYFLTLGKECQKLLTLIIEQVPYEEIAEQLGYKSEKIVRNQKYKCKETLIKLINEDPEYKSFMRENNT